MQSNELNRYDPYPHEVYSLGGDEGGKPLTSKQRNGYVNTNCEKYYKGERQ